MPTRLTSPPRAGDAERHPIEDAVMTNFFHLLWKRKNGVPEHECRGLDVRIPHTICYEHNFPKGWYSTTAHGITRRTGKDIDTKAVRDALGKGRFTEQEDDIVALYIEKRASEPSGESFSLEFFDRARLREFLSGGARQEEGEFAPPKNGVLQQFITPQGDHNSMIQVVWSRHLCLIEKRENVYPLNPRDRAARIRGGGVPPGTTASPWERACTYQGPAALSLQAYCAPNVMEMIKRVCLQIVEHFTNLEHAQVERMVLYFKTDPDQNLWLLWCSSIRVKQPALPLQHPGLVPSFLLQKKKDPRMLPYLSDEDRSRLLAPVPSMGQLGDTYGTGEESVKALMGSAGTHRVPLPTHSRLHRRPCTAPHAGVALVRAGLQGDPPPADRVVVAVDAEAATPVGADKHAEDAAVCLLKQRPAAPRFLPLQALLRAEAERSAPQRPRTATSPRAVRPPQRAESQQSQRMRGAAISLEQAGQKALQRRRLHRLTGLIEGSRKGHRTADHSILLVPPAAVAAAHGDDLSCAIRKMTAEPALLEAAERATAELRQRVEHTARSTETVLEWADGVLYSTYSHFLQSGDLLFLDVPTESCPCFPDLLGAVADLPGVVQAPQLESQQAFVFERKPHLLKLRASIDALKRRVVAARVLSLRREVALAASALPASVGSAVLVVAMVAVHEAAAVKKATPAASGLRGHAARRMRGLSQR
eukprot:TRINITY_DN16935_c0_g1_i1.p1 TRINITY_DN16935_c0_g1~~TRINITY_DN16935_c0_g1_i1.p1  ORF type:complete len:705 (+),score=190.79 TRINITY_DN16935_c0_g1_i1:64-2178(+)